MGRLCSFLTASLLVALKESARPSRKEGEIVESKELARKVTSILKKEGKHVVPVRAYITNKVIVDAEQERHLHDRPGGNGNLTEHGEFKTTRASSRKARAGPFSRASATSRTSTCRPGTILSISTSLIPFLEHDDNTPAPPWERTCNVRLCLSFASARAARGYLRIEGLAARASGHALLAEEDGEIPPQTRRNLRRLPFRSQADLQAQYVRAQQPRHVLQRMRPCVVRGIQCAKARAWPTVPQIEQESWRWANLLVAYMSWEGYNFEDAVIISDRIVQKGDYDSIHIGVLHHGCPRRKLGPEIVTRDIPNVGEAKLKDLGTDGIVRIDCHRARRGSSSSEKSRRKGEDQTTPEERLLQPSLAIRPRT